jgi:hypothetical protein
MNTWVTTAGNTATLERALANNINDEMALN